MDNQTATVGKRVPNFDLPCTNGSIASRRHVTLADYQDRWLVIVFYPRDFSLVCPTELTALSSKMDEFRKRGCDILAVSTDSLESHERWIATPRAQGGLGVIHFSLASDLQGIVSRAYGVYVEKQHIALRGLFIIDPNGVLQYQGVHNLSVGRRTDDILRILAALETGGMCPEDWHADCATLDATRSLVSGSMISHYRIEAEVGGGAFASVFRARDTVLDRIVALKVFKPGRLQSSLSALTEARSAAALNHPNVCTVFAVDDSEGIPVIVMEFVPGRPLNSILRDGAMPQRRVVEVGRQIALGMAEAHRLGITHGDLKPANVMLTGEGVVKITDFGLSRRVASTENSDATEDWVSNDTGKIAGTPSYMSPEQSRGDLAIPASDVFSLAVLLYEMLTARRAFVGDNVLQVLDEIQKVDSNRFASEVPEPFTEILRHSLAREARDRQMSMDRIAEMLT